MEAALNFTANFKFQILNLAKIDLEFEATPVMASGGIQDYHTTYFGDNCLWMYYNYNFLKYTTRIRKQFAKCGFNIRDMIDSSDSWDDFVHTLKYQKDWFLRGQKCEIDEPVNEQEISFLSGEFLPNLNQDDYVYYSYCFGDYDLTDWLFPDENVDVRNHDQDIYDEMIKDRKEKEE